MSHTKHIQKLLSSGFTALASLVWLSGCEMVVLNPSGDIATRQGDMLMTSVWLMLLIIVPVMALIVLFAWRYRASNKEARYEPEWDHSTKLELAIWAAPLLIIICLGAITWVGTHLLDPYRPLSRIAEGKPATSTETLEVNVVALDWKWLFIYPKQGIATVNELVLPTDQPVHFRITASSVMNAFYVPAMAGMIYAMPGMETKLHAVINHEGVYDGLSANYSGSGFSNMRFKTHAVSHQGFDKWVAKVRTSPEVLDDSTYLALERPSEKVPVQYYRNIDPGLYPKIVNLCVESGKMCMGEMMAIDERGGLGMAGLMLAERVTYDKNAPRGSQPGSMRYDFTALCTTRLKPPELSIDPLTGLPSSTPLYGYNLAVPVSTRIMP